MPCPGSVKSAQVTRRVERAHPLDQGTDERRAFVAGERLVGDRPQHDRRATAITQHEFVRLLERVGQSVLVGPLDPPVDGKFDPGEHPSLMASATIASSVDSAPNEVGAGAPAQSNNAAASSAPEARAAGRASACIEMPFRKTTSPLTTMSLPRALDGAEADRVGHGSCPFRRRPCIAEGPGCQRSCSEPPLSTR